VTITNSHPMHLTAGRERIWKTSGSIGYKFNAPIRRIAGISTRTMSLTLLANNAGIVRDDWTAFVSVGTYTLALIIL
jgi:hypothetical protein